MTAIVDWATNKANAGFLNAANKVEHLLGQALQLKPANPKHITIAMEMAASLSFTFSSYAYSATSVPPMVLSATAEIHEHLDDSSCNVVSAPVWSNIHPDDPQSQHSLLYPVTLAYGKPPPPTNPPVASPSGSNTAVTQDANVLAGKGKGKAREDPEAKPTEQRGHGMERKQLQCMSAPRSQSHAPKAKMAKCHLQGHDHQLRTNGSWTWPTFPNSNPAPEARKKASLPTRLPPALKKTWSQSKSFTITSDDEEDAEPTAQTSTKEEEDCCGPCIHRGLICLQGYNNSGAALTPATTSSISVVVTVPPFLPPKRRNRQRPQLCRGVQNLAAKHHRCMSLQRQPLQQQHLHLVHLHRLLLPPPLPLPLLLPAPIPIPTPTPTTTPITAPAIAAAPTSASTPDGPADASVVALKEQSRGAKASIGEKRLLEANQRLADQEATSKLLAEQFEELRWQLLPPPVPASPVTACLPVIIGNLSGNNKNIGAAEDGAEPASGAIAEAEEVAESVSGVVAGLSGNNMDVEEDLAESASASGGNNMDVAEAPAESAPASGINAGLSGNTNDVAEAESASIASSAQE
ncbi:uncharacterized protein EDB91DRAFT_1088097 [Suillus paluster]|uniref:uncharacterized protein n=1 Tax=Suillus paluster TaxID=48578 RepID=UPI001B87BDED|nr:uncharacterized protein EDB91DRAFT_1088097 [Suillus paluster]KAG1722547.1 hypothetical protein EDB91DRAFT_1088097 [Suillus paluster]